MLRRYKMKLNLTKCAFSTIEKFMSIMMLERGIEANPEKVQTIIRMKPPKDLNEVQKLAGRIATLNGFVFRSTNKCLPFFQVIQKIQD